MHVPFVMSLVACRHAELGCTARLHVWHDLCISALRLPHKRSSGGSAHSTCIYVHNNHTDMLYRVRVRARVRVRLGVRVGVRARARVRVGVRAIRVGVVGGSVVVG